MKNYATVSDADLWDDFRQGNGTVSRAAYAAIYERYARVLYNYGYKIAQERQLTEDCLQDLFLIILESRERLAPTDSIKYYLFKALRREIVRKLQKRQLFSGGEGSEEAVEFRAVFTYEPTWLDHQISQELSAELLRELNGLPARQKEAIFLKFFDNLSYEEIAGVMGIEQTSAYKIIYKALDRLQKRLMVDFLALVVMLGGISAG
jgi:RNA polymerase sigma-70 factor (ECF subfamily)